MVKLFITGATGFIGQQLVAQLKRQGEVIKVLSRAQNFEYETVATYKETVFQMRY